jgi:hypothetical protein
VRPRAIAGADTATPPTPAALGVQLAETFIRLKEKAELMRRQVLAVEEETDASLAMRGDGTTVSSTLPQPYDALWRALPRIGIGAKDCPQCQQLLEALPRATSALRICTKCGFVARPLEARRKRPTLQR